MAFQIGFVATDTEISPTKEIPTREAPSTVPRRSVVQVYFPKQNRTLAYYNDLFDLHCGDLVYVEGKMEGFLGRVLHVSYNFKIKLSDYRRVLAVVNTSVHGRFFMAGSHFVTFDKNALPKEQVCLWFKAPEHEEVVSGRDDTSFKLENLKEMNVEPEIAMRGQDYYLKNRVRYLCVNDGVGYAIVEGSDVYEVEFQYENGEVRGLVCSCFCSDGCKHEVAAMLQLRDALRLIAECYAEHFQCTGYFAEISKEILFSFAVEGMDSGEFTL